MELWIPFMLFIVEWQPDQPGKFELQRQEVLYSSIEQCEEAGRALVESKSAAGSVRGGKRHSFHCVSTPHPDEFEKAFRDRIGKSE